MCPGEHGDGLGLGAGRADHAVSEAFHHFLDVHGNQRLVLDDEDVRGHLSRNLIARLDQQPGKLVLFHVEDFSGFGFAEPFDRDQQERLTRQGSQGVQIGGGALLPGGLRLGLRNADGDRREQLGENLVKRDPVARRLWKHVDIGDDRFKQRCNQRIAAFLRSRDGSGEAAQERQMRRDGSGQTHVERLPQMTCFNFLRSGLMQVPGNENANPAKKFHRQGTNLYEKRLIAKSGNQMRVSFALCVE